MSVSVTSRKLSSGILDSFPYVLLHSTFTERTAEFVKKTFESREIGTLSRAGKIILLVKKSFNHYGL